MAKVDYHGPRGDTLTVQIEFPGGDLTGATIRATLKAVLDAANNDDAALWKADFDPSDPEVCDDPTTGVCFITVPAGGPSVDGTYKALPDKIYWLDVEATFADGTVKSLKVSVQFDKDGTRRQA